ncbi:shikimate dehydrogenase, partial [Mycobacterium palustre]|nr:shikimate dehydrogenase [Mycobacterium palustre]
MSSTARAEQGARKAAVLGSPVAHSRSPQLHLAAYRALGLRGWTYERIECGAAELPGVVGGFGPEWVGVSVTAPGKFAALRFADERTERAELVGSANTLVRTPGGWRADNTDVDGVAGAVGPMIGASGWALVCGSGGTAPAAVAASRWWRATGVTVVARDAAKAARL